MVNVIGILTFETVPGLNRHRRKALVAALSKIGFPVLCAMSARYAATWTDVDDTHSAARNCRERASYGYCGRGAMIASAFAEEIDRSRATGSLRRLEWG